jgi:hypothetical protein
VLTRRAVGWIFAALLLFYALSTNGRVLSPDAVIRARAAEGLLLRGSPAIDARGVPPGFLAAGGEGRSYPKYEAGPSFAALPFVALGLLAERLAPAGSSAIFRGPLFLWYSPDDAATAWRLCAVGLTNAAVVALLCALLYALLAEIGWAPRAAALATATAAFASPLWVYSRDLFAEPLAAAGLVLFLLGVERAVRAPRRRLAALAGLGLGVSVLARTAHLALLPIALLVALHALRAVERPRRAGLAAVMALGLAVPLSLMAWWNWLRFDSIWSSGYGDELALWTTPPLVGLRGLLASPGRGLLTHFPLALLAVVTTPAAWRRSPRTTLFAWGTLATLLAVYCRWHGWDGGWCFGPRFLVPAVPLLVLLSAPLFDRPRPWVKGAGALLLAASAFIAFTGTLVAYTDFDQALRHAGGPVPYLEVARWSWEAYPPVAYWSFAPKVFYLCATLFGVAAAWPVAALFGAGLALLVPIGRRAWRLAAAPETAAPRFALSWRTLAAVLLTSVLFAALTARGGS